MSRRQLSEFEEDSDSSQEEFLPKTIPADSLKDDSEIRPLWVSAGGRLILESFSVLSAAATEFLTAVAEPISRPAHIHEYKITEYSLYAAVSVGLDAKNILSALDLLAKNHLPQTLIEFVQKVTNSYGKIKVVLRQNRFWLETIDEQVRKKLLEDETICSALILPNVVSQSVDLNLRNSSSGIDPISAEVVPVEELDSDDDDWNRLEKEILLLEQQQLNDSIPENSKNSLLDLEPVLDPDPNKNSDAESIPDPDLQNSAAESSIDKESSIADKFQKLFSTDNNNNDSFWKTPCIEIRKSQIEILKKRCADLSLPVLEEYDFRADSSNPDLQIDLKNSTKLRDYQQTSLRKLFGNGRARSGIVVLPCGAGKTLVGVAAAATIKKSVLVLCTSSVSVEQWAREFRFWTNLQAAQVAKFTSETKERFSGSAGVMISTYTMLSFPGKRAHDAQILMDFVQSVEWGLLLLDEVHVVPAEMFRKVLSIVAAHAKLGLTATLVREDNKIANLNYLIGPKLYEADWTQLAKSGHIASVQCAEVWCDMPAPFYREYLREHSRRRRLIYTMNPTKIQACQSLVEMHESMGDKIIVFSDNVFALKHYATILNKPYIYGGTSQSERMRVLQQFRFNPALNTIFISKIGDTSIDLPEANCLIQISSHYGSRRQEAQRLGRILRAKRTKNASSEFDAFFYSLVSKDTTEMYFATKRQQFLVDQGYNFRIITQMNVPNQLAENKLVYAHLRDQLELLNTVLMSTDSDLSEKDETDLFDGIHESKNDNVSESGSDSDSMDWIKRSTGNISSYSGADSMAYIEYNRGTSSGLVGSRKRRRNLDQ